jgi:diguanylate cyclase (GGDEF)-like protein
MKKAWIALFGILFSCYAAATMVKSDFWGDLLSPLIMLFFCLETFISYCVKDKNKISRIIGLLFSLGLFSWGIADILWAIYDMLFHIDPQDDVVISFCYMLTNLFFAAALFAYAYGVFRKWNIVQIVIDSIVMSFFVIELIWTIFLHENTDNIIILRGDWISTMSIILDVMIAVGIIIWYMSVRSGQIMIHLRLLAIGALLFICTDLAYYYHYLYGTYEANSLLDLIYVISFGIITLAAVIRRKAGQTLIYDKLHNTGQKGKGFVLLLAPILLILFRGFDVTRLLQFVSVILIYNMVSNYIQNTIYKEGLLLKEREYSNELEQKVMKRTEELEEKNNVLTHLLDQDFITGLKNRRFLLAYLEKGIASLKEGDTIVVLYIDINRFKMILTMYGHYIGDMILYEMAEKLKPLEKMTENNVLTSYRDDNFVYAAIGRYDYKQGYELAQKAIELCSDIYRIDEYQIRVTVNIGISVFPKDASTKEELMKHADIAMLQGRSRGFNQAQEFDAELRHRWYSCQQDRKLEVW